MVVVSEAFGLAAEVLATCGPSCGRRRVTRRLGSSWLVAVLQVLPCWERSGAPRRCRGWSKSCIGVPRGELGGCVSGRFMTLPPLQASNPVRSRVPNLEVAANGSPVVKVRFHLFRALTCLQLVLPPQLYLVHDVFFLCWSWSATYAPARRI